MHVVKTVSIALSLFLAGPAAAAEIEALAAECDSCHGSMGVSAHDDVPTIAGQDATFLSKSLRSYQIWGRPCLKSSYRTGDTARPKTDMCKISSGLSDEDIEALGIYYSEKEFVPASQEFDASRVAAGAALHEANCDTCHKEGGHAAGRGPRLAGQWVPYLKTALKYVPTGEHLVPPMMERAITTFSAEEIDTLMNYYASQQD